MAKPTSQNGRLPKKLQLLRRQKKWMQAGIIQHKQVQLGQKWIDNINTIRQIPRGPQRQLAILENQTSMIQQTQGLTSAGARLSISEAGAMNRHQLGYWLSDKIPSHILANSVLDILTQKVSTENTRQNVADQRLHQGHGGTNLSRLSILSEAHLQLED